MKKLLILGMSSVFALGANAQSLEDRVEALEFAGYEDVFKFSGQLEMMYSSTTSKDNDVDDSEASSQQWRTWLKLDMNSTPSDKLQFFGRLSMAKQLNRMSNYSDGSFGDIDGQLEEGQGEKNSEVYVERAFVNYRFTDKLTYTFGRLPTANGTPYHMTRDEAQAGAYPFLSYNAFFDGMALSYQVNKELSAKLIYTPFQFEMGTTATGAAATTSSGKTVESPNTNIYSVMLDYNKQGLSWARRMNLVLQYLSVKNIVLDADDTNALGASQGQTDFSFNLDRLVLALELNGVAGSRFDLGLQHMMLTHSTNSPWVTANGVGGTNEFNFMTADGKEENATISVLTMRYAINGNNKVGIQYTQASQYAFASDLVSKTPIAFYGVPGSGMHLFYNRKFDGGLKLNTGLYSVKRDYEATVADFFGERTDADKESTAAYLGFVANF